MKYLVSYFCVGLRNYNDRWICRINQPKEFHFDSKNEITVFPPQAPRMLIFVGALIFGGEVLVRMRALIKNVKKRFSQQQESGDQ